MASRGKNGTGETKNGYVEITVVANMEHYRMVAALVSINEVTLHWARTALGRVTVFWRANHLGMLPATQVNSSCYGNGDQRYPDDLWVVWLGKDFTFKF